ncbi:MAG TPA: hypothetical protein VHT53_09810 [Candidatus Elarobacter sp.]|jgi:hypothetical protein|nr:hypothetical protein [Candidatus Elarobacter sp.]
MSVDSASLPQPGFYSYPSSLPTGLSRGSAASTGTASATSSSSSAAGSGSSAAATVNPYQAAYASLQQQDTAELMQVTLGSAQSAQANVASVLAQAAALQQQEAASPPQATTVPITMPSVPSMTSIVQQTTTNANSDIANGTLGASIDTTA